VSEGLATYAELGHDGRSALGMTNRPRLEVVYNKKDRKIWPVDDFIRSIENLHVQQLEIETAYSCPFLGESDPLTSTVGPHQDTVKTIILRTYVSKMSFNFLLWLRKLENIVLYDHDCYTPPSEIDPTENPEVMDIKEMIMKRDKLRNSNIWQMIPSLKQVSIFSTGMPRKRLNHCTRNMKI